MIIKRSGFPGLFSLAERQDNHAHVHFSTLDNTGHFQKKKIVVSVPKVIKTSKKRTTYIELNHSYKENNHRYHENTYLIFAVSVALSI